MGLESTVDCVVAATTAASTASAATLSLSVKTQISNLDDISISISIRFQAETVRQPIVSVSV